MKRFPALIILSTILLFISGFLLYAATPAEAATVSLWAPQSTFKRETTYNFEIRSPKPRTHYFVWVDGDKQVQKDPTSDASGSSITNNMGINVRGVTGAQQKKVCLSDDPTILTASPGNFLNARATCKWSVSIYVTQNDPPITGNDPLDSATNPKAKSPPSSDVYISMTQSNFKSETQANVMIHNPDKNAHYYVWVDGDKQAQKDPQNLSGDTTVSINVRGVSVTPKKVCMNDVRLGAGNIFPDNSYECRWFVRINVLQSDPTTPGKAVDSKTSPNPEERPRGTGILTMDQSNFLRETQADFHIKNPDSNTTYYVWVDGDKMPQVTVPKPSGDYDGRINVRGESKSPKKVCMNDIFLASGSFFPTNYECRLYVLINVSKDTPTDPGKPVSSEDNMQGDSKTNGTPTPIVTPILPPCIEGLDKVTGAVVTIPTLAPDNTNEVEVTNKLKQIKKCTAVDSAIGRINTDPFGFIKKLFQIFLSIAGGIALLIIIRAGYRYMTSQGNPESIKAAQEEITSAIVGLLFLIFSMVILQIIGVDILQLPGFGS